MSIQKGFGKNIAYMPVVSEVKPPFLTQAGHYIPFSRETGHNLLIQSIYNRDVHHKIDKYIKTRRFTIISRFTRPITAAQKLTKQAFIRKHSKPFLDSDGTFSVTLMVSLKLLPNTGYNLYQSAPKSSSPLVDPGANILFRPHNRPCNTRQLKQHPFSNSDEELLLKGNRYVRHHLLKVKGTFSAPKVHIQHNSLYSRFGHFTIQVESTFSSPEPSIIDNSARGPPNYIRE